MRGGDTKKDNDDVKRQSFNKQTGMATCFKSR